MCLSAIGVTAPYGRQYVAVRRLESAKRDSRPSRSGTLPPRRARSRLRREFLSGSDKNRPEEIPACRLAASSKPHAVPAWGAANQKGRSACRRRFDEAREKGGLGGSGTLPPVPCAVKIPPIPAFPGGASRGVRSDEWWKRPLCQRLPAPPSDLFIIFHLTKQGLR